MNKTPIWYTDMTGLRFPFHSGRNAKLWILSRGNKGIWISIKTIKSNLPFHAPRPLSILYCAISLPLTSIKERLLVCSKEQLVQWQSSVVYSMLAKLWVRPKAVECILDLTFVGISWPSPGASPVSIGSHNGHQLFFYVQGMYSRVNI